MSFISKEHAMAMAAGRRKFLSVYEGRSVLFMPFTEHARYASTHYVPELSRSVLCSGEGSCRWHHIQEVAKAHVAALVFRKAMPYAARDCRGLPHSLPYDPDNWAAKIVELTEHCLDAFHADEPFGTLCTISRPPGRKNNKVEFAWLHGHQLEGFPTQPLRPEEIVPAVIRGAYYPSAEVVPLDNSGGSPIKHKI